MSFRRTILRLFGLILLLLSWSITPAGAQSPDVETPAPIFLGPAGLASSNYSPFMADVGSAADQDVLVDDGLESEPDPVEPSGKTLGLVYLYQPANNARLSGSSTTLRWYRTSGAVRYYLRIWRSGWTGSATTTNNQMTFSGRVGMTYYWYIRAYDSSGNYRQSVTWTFHTAGANPTSNAPVPYSPSYGARLTGRSCWLRWQASSGAVRYFYRIWCTGWSGGGDINSTSVWFNGRPNTTYSWWVRGINSSGTARQSATWNFRTANVSWSITAPRMISPANGATTAANVGLHWESVHGAVRYQYRVWRSGWVWTNYTTARSIAMIAARSGTTYYWWVRAYDSAGRSAQSATRWFRIR